MNFPRFFIDRPVFAAVISIVTVIAGVVALFVLPVAQYPDIAPPTVTVSTTYPGANAKVVADTVATPIEEQVNGVEKMLYMSSQSTNTGTMRLTVTFQVGTNLDIAQVQVQNRVAVALPSLPSDVQRQGVVVRKASPDFTEVVTLFSPDNRYDTLYLSNFATLQVKDELARLPGVGDINVFGVRDYSMRIWLNPNQLASRSLTAGDVITALNEQNIQVAAGTIGGPPLPPGTTQFEYTVNAQGRLTDPSQFADIVVKTGADGRITRIGDIARVELGAADYSTSNTLNGKPAVGIGIYQLPGTNAIQTAAAVQKEMEVLKRTRFPPGLEFSAPYNTTIFVRNSIQDVVVTLFEAIGLVSLVVLIFLQSWRAALIPLIAIPVSLIGTFAIMWIAGFSLNMLTLFGLVLAIGIVVDDAIVVVENVDRWIDDGLPPRQAAYRAMEEVTPAVIAIAFGLSAVFVPVAFVSGITGQFYRQFALTIAFSTILSAFNSLTLSPALAALLLKPKNIKQDWLTRGINFLVGWFFHLFNRGLAATNQGYIAGLRYVMRWAVLALVLYGGLIFLAYRLFKIVPTGFIPAQDQGYVLVNLQMPDAASIDRTNAVLARLSSIALKTPGVHDAVAVGGFSILSGSTSSAAGLMFIILDPFEQRIGKPDHSGDAIVAKLSAQFSQVQDGLALVFPPAPVRGIGSAGGFKMQIEDRSGSETPQQIEAMTESVIAEARKDPRVTNLFSTFRANVPQLYAKLDRTKAKQAQVAVTDIFQTLQVYLGGLYVNDFNYLGRTWHVMAQAEAQFRAKASEVAQFKVRSQTGAMVPLGTVLDLQDITGPDRAQRYNLYDSAEINGTATPGTSSGQAIAAMQQAAIKVLPRQYGYEWTELAYQEVAAGNTAFFIFPLCVLFVFLAHSAEYESFALALAIILIVPMCLLCGIAGVWFRHMDDNIFTQIGFVVLAGMSVKNAVLIVEFAKQQQEQGLNAFDAALEAARLRLRPILMTSFAFIFGVLPLIVATGAGAEMRQALGTVVFFGMIGVTFFGVFLTPVFFDVIRRLTRKSGPLKHEDHKPHASPPPPVG